MELTDKKILVTGGGGFLGSYVVETLRARGVPMENVFTPRSAEYDLRNRSNCERVVKDMDVVFHLAANAGGIGYNIKYPGTLFYDNLVMNTELMEAARKAGVEKFLGVGSICSYPKITPLPFHEKDFWNGYPEETNASYGLAKKMMQVQGQAYSEEFRFNAISVQIANLFGPRDSFDPQSSHVIPAIMLKIREAKINNISFIDVWGTGEPTREFFYVTDAAEGIVLAMEKYDDPTPVNLGSGEEVSIRTVVETIAQEMGFTGELRWNPGQPDGQPRRVFDVAKAKETFGFVADITFTEGIRETVAWYKTQQV